jgi:tetratricopeptide (TPR) repeat protein
MLTRARGALKFPDRMIELKAEMLDRLGLAYQESRKWDKAADAFEKAFQLNLSPRPNTKPRSQPAIRRLQHLYGGRGAFG